MDKCKNIAIISLLIRIHFSNIEDKASGNIFHMHRPSDLQLTMIVFILVSIVCVTRICFGAFTFLWCYGINKVHICLSISTVPLVLG
jgi:hypothetical protein